MNQDFLMKRLAREMSARKQAERLLEERSLELFSMNLVLQNAADRLSLQNAQMDRILEKIWSGVILLDEHQKIVRANSYAEHVFEEEEQSLIGKEISSLAAFNSAQKDKLIALGKDVEDEQSEIEFVGYRKNGEKFPLKLTITETTIRDKKHYVWIFRDLTKEKSNKKKRERLEEELRRALRLESLGTLASGLAHEINTPVQYVGDNLHFLSEAFSDLLAAYEKNLNKGNSVENADLIDENEVDLDFLKTEIPTALSQALEGTERVTDIIRSVRNFSHPGAKEKTEYNLNEAIENTITISRNQWKYIAEIKTDLQQDLPALACIPGEINQVLLNLMVNAAHAIEEKQPKEKGQITISTRIINNYTEIKIQDTGNGIPQSIKDRIFDPFFTTKGVGKGTGQGLSLAYNIVVTGHGGKISFESEEGEGTTFTVLLPCAVKTPPQSKDISEDINKNGRTEYA